MASFIASARSLRRGGNNMMVGTTIITRFAPCCFGLRPFNLEPPVNKCLLHGAKTDSRRFYGLERKERFQLGPESPPIPPILHGEVAYLLDRARIEDEFRRGTGTKYRQVAERQLGVIEVAKTKALVPEPEYKVDEKDRTIYHYWIKEGFDSKDDFFDLERDKESLPLPDWISADDKERIDDKLNYCRIPFLLSSKPKEELPKYDPDKFVPDYYYSTDVNEFLDELNNFYGIQVDFNKGTWHVIEKFVPSPLSFQKLREELAQEILAFLENNNFQRLKEKDRDAEDLDAAKTRIFFRPLPVRESKKIREKFKNVGGVFTLRVRSSIHVDKDEVTTSGNQPIHIYIEYTKKDTTWKREQRVFVSKRIVRKGKIKDIIKRLSDRVQEAERHAMEEMDKLHICRECKEAPLFKSKKGNMVCAHFCFTK